MKLREIIKEYGLGQVVRPAKNTNEFDNYPFWIMEKEGLQLKVVYLPCGSVKNLSWPNKIARIELNSNEDFEIIELTNIELICLMNDAVYEYWEYRR